MEKTHIEELLRSEIQRESTLRGAAEALHAQLAVVEQQIAALRTILRLRDEETGLQEPLVAALGLVGVLNTKPTPTASPPSRTSDADDDDTEAETRDGHSPSSADEVKVSRTIGKRIFAEITRFLNKPQRQIAYINLIYGKLSPELRAEWEAVPSDKDAMFRFRRLLRGNKDDFSLERGSGFVTYLKYHPEPNFTDGFPPPPSVSGACELIVTARRFSTATTSWHYQYKFASGGKIHEAPFETFVNALTSVDKPRTVGIMSADNTVARLASFKVDGIHRIASHLDGRWTTDFDYRLPITTANVQSQ